MSCLSTFYVGILWVEHDGKCKAVVILSLKTLRKMIRYTPQNQLSIENFKTPFEKTLGPDNRWVKLAGLLPWDEMAQIYFRSLSTGMGRPSIDARIALGALIAKHRLNLSGREAIETVQENICLQYFLGYSSFNPEPPFDAPLSVALRKRMGADKFDEMSCRIIEKAKGAGRPKKEPKNNPSNGGGCARGRWGAEEKQGNIEAGCNGGRPDDRVPDGPETFEPGPLGKRAHHWHPVQKTRPHGQAQGLPPHCQGQIHRPCQDAEKGQAQHTHRYPPTTGLCMP